MQLPVYVEWTWWLRWYVVLNVTDEGTFAEDKVPDDYGGPILKIEQNIVLFMVTESGYMQRLYLTPGMEKVMDKTRKAGMGCGFEPFEDLIDYTQVEPIGPSSEYLVAYLQERPGIAFTDNEKQVYRELLRATIQNES